MRNFGCGTSMAVMLVKPMRLLLENMNSFIEKKKKSNIIDVTEKK